MVSGAQAELKITAGEGAFGASTVLTSGPDKHASLVLSVQSAADAAGELDMDSPGTAEAQAVAGAKGLEQQMAVQAAKRRREERRADATY